MKTIFVKPASIEKKWYVIDAEGKNLGRVAVKAARILRGKDKPEYVPHQDMGDYVIIINAAKASVTGNKVEDKMYYRHSMYPGGLKQISAGELRSKNAVRLIEKSVNGMLPHNTLGRAQGMKLKVFVGSEHTHAAQQPEVLDIKGLI